MRPQPRLAHEMLIAVLVKGVNVGKGCKQGNTNKEGYVTSKRRLGTQFFTQSTSHREMNL